MRKTGLWLGIWLAGIAAFFGAIDIAILGAWETWRENRKNRA